MRKSIVAGATALAVVATGLAVTGILGTARPASAALGDVPADCIGLTRAYRSDGQRLAYRYSEQKTSIEAIADDNLGWVPTALAEGAYSGGEDVDLMNDLVTHPTDGNLYYLHRVSQRIDGTWKITEQTTTRLASGFAGTRILAGGPGGYYYSVMGSSLYRFETIFGEGEPTISTPVKMPGDDWDTVNTLHYQRSDGTPDAPVHVLFGTTTNGRLKEWRIDETNPTAVTATILQPSGWDVFTSLTGGWCTEHPDGRTLFGITADGDAEVYFDAGENDSDGSDIKGGSLGSLGWTEKAY